MREADILATAQELRSQIRLRAGLANNWPLISEELRQFYLMLARRTEGVGSVEKMQ